MKTDFGEDASVAEGSPPARESSSGLRRWPILWISIVAAGLVLTAIVVWIGSGGPSSREVDKRLIREHVASQVRPKGYEPGEFTQFTRDGDGYRFEMIVVDATGLDAGTVTGTLRRGDRGGSGSAPTINSRHSERPWGAE